MTDDLTLDGWLMPFSTGIQHDAGDPGTEHGAVDLRSDRFVRGGDEPFQRRDLMVKRTDDRQTLIGVCIGQFGELSECCPVRVHGVENRTIVEARLDRFVDPPVETGDLRVHTIGCGGGQGR